MRTEMETSGQARILAQMRSGTRAAAVVGMFVGAVVLAGWAFHADFLKSLSPNLASMKTNTALSMLLGGVSLWCLSEPARPRWKNALGYGCATLMSLIGVLTIFEMTLRWNLGIDQLLFKDAAFAVGTSSPNRVGINTATCIALIGAGLLLMERRIGKQRPSQIIALASGVLSLFAVVGYVFDVQALYSISVFTGMAIHTAATALILLLGMLLARSQDGFMSIISEDGPGGELVRKLLPVALVLPTFGGWVRWEAQKYGRIGTGTGIIVFALFNTVSLIAFISVGVVLLNRLVERTHESDEKLRLLVTGVKDYAILMLDPEGRVTTWNDGAERIKGYRTEEIIGKHFSKFYAAEAVAQGKPSQELKIAVAEGRFEEEGWRLRKDGSRFWANVVITALHDKTGQLRGFGKVTRDITDRRQAAEEVERQRNELARSNARLLAANNELESFSYSVSHDLRAPLRTIDGFSHALLEDSGDRLDDEGKTHLNRIRAAAQRMGLLIDDLLNLSRLSSAEMRRQPLDISALASSVASELKKAQPERQIELQIERGLETTADPGLLRVVLENLLSNAWKFTSKREFAHIEFGMARGNGARAYFVRDDGAGFDPAYADRLFGAFQRLHAITEFAGTGVGLATVQRIVQRHGGRIWAESAVDRGATFYFTLSETAS